MKNFFTGLYAIVVILAVIMCIAVSVSATDKKAQEESLLINKIEPHYSLCQRECGYNSLSLNNTYNSQVNSCVQICLERKNKGE